MITIARKAAKILGFSINEWADKLQISYLSSYLKFTGKREFTLRELEAISDESGTRYDDVIFELNNYKKGR